MKLRIKTKFLAVLLIISLLIIMIISTTHYFFEKDLTNKYTDHSIETIKYLVQKNNEISDRILTPFTERYLELAVDDVADEIHFIQKKNNKINNELLQNNNDIRKLLSEYSYFKDQQVISFVVIDPKVIVLSHNPAEENKGYQQWIDRCPEITKYINNDKCYKGYYNLKIDGQLTPIYMNILHVSDTDYDVIAFLNLNKYLTPTNLEKKEKLNQELIKLEATTKIFLNKTIVNIGIITLIIIVIILILCVPISLYFATTITKPICILRNEVLKIGQGNFNVQIKEQGSVEVVDLIKAFNYLGKELQNYIKNLKKEITARQKVENEIKIAAKIQRATLPDVTNEFNTKEFSIAPLLEPAAEASGDFYDFFFLPNGKLALMIADVSGKGIPAAFFMALSKAVLHSMCILEPNDPSIAISKTNNILASSNKEYMFVTVFLMYYDIKTGKIEFANAGHHDAILLSNKNIERFGKFDDTVLGIMKNIAFKKGEIIIEHNDSVIIYTDGITEAVSPDQVQFGAKRLEELIVSNSETAIEDLSSLVVKTVRKYENNTRFDDATILILKRK